MSKQDDWFPANLRQIQHYSGKEMTSVKGVCFAAQAWLHLQCKGNLQALLHSSWTQRQKWSGVSGQMTVMMDNNRLGVMFICLWLSLPAGVRRRARMSWACRTGRRSRMWRMLFITEMSLFTRGMQEQSVYFYIRIFRLVIIEQFHRVTVLLVLISPVARWRMETALSHLEIKWSGVWLVPSNCGKEKMSICRSSYATLCNELTDWIRSVHLPLSYCWYEYRTVTSRGDVVTRKSSLEYKNTTLKTDSSSEEHTLF